MTQTPPTNKESALIVLRLVEVVKWEGRGRGDRCEKGEEPRGSGGGSHRGDYLMRSNSIAHQTIRASLTFWCTLLLFQNWILPVPREQISNVPEINAKTGNFQSRSKARISRACHTFVTWSRRDLRPGTRACLIDIAHYIYPQMPASSSCEKSPSGSPACITADPSDPMTPMPPQSASTAPS